MPGISVELEVFPSLDGNKPQIFIMAATVPLQLSCPNTHSDRGQERSLVGPPRSPLQGTRLATLHSPGCLWKTCRCS